MSKSEVGLVVTSIQPAVPIMQRLASQAHDASVPFVVVGDRKSPETYELYGAQFLSVRDQHSYFGDFSRALPENHYARKNLGYLVLLSKGIDWVLETDDDNSPLEDFLKKPADLLSVRTSSQAQGWINAYSYFSPSEPVWPRGFPLEKVLSERTQPSFDEVICIKPRLVQGLANANPDVDAVFRLTRKLPIYFRSDAPIALGSGQWCPFNSQNTLFHRSIAPLLYLPSYCSFRMTDIWRSFVAQRCLWAMGDKLVFSAPTVVQDRNEHDLLNDFSSEVPGYQNNEKIRRALESLSLEGDANEDIFICYEELVRVGIFHEKELVLLKLWLAEVSAALSYVEVKQ